jgi:ribosomal protein S20
MANIKSQVKRIEIGEIRNAKRSAEKAKAHTLVKKVETLVVEKKKAEAIVALKDATSILDQLAQAHIISDNSAARKKAHLQKEVAALK